MWPNVDASSDLGHGGYKVPKRVDVVIYAQFPPCGVFRLAQGTCKVAGVLDPCTTGGCCPPVRLSFSKSKINPLLLTDCFCGVECSLGWAWVGFEG